MIKPAAILDNLEQVINGKRPQLELLLISILAGGHSLLEDVPGVGKTTLAKALAKTFGGDFRRIQFTPDLLPTDILGSSIYSPKTGEFDFKPGPIFSHVVLADEINRASPRTQSALLEAMSEGQVTTEGNTVILPDPFL
ncbi:MAG: AAA family ATPase, partial [Candidatus Eremiobacteraeota bacterium]|nr:AAA family ATPase [Candidatus Eremiobacteraeota bacterium]